MYTTRRPASAFRNPVTRSRRLGRRCTRKMCSGGTWEHVVKDAKPSLERLPCNGLWDRTTRHWTATALRRIGAMPKQMTRRIARWWPHATEVWPASVKRWFGVVMKASGPGRGTPEGGPGMRREWRSANPKVGCAEHLSRRHASWRHTMRRLNAPSDGQSVRLRRGHRYVGERGWDHPLQATVNLCEERPWEERAQAREAWKRKEQAFVARVFRNPPMRVGTVSHRRQIVHKAPQSWECYGSRSCSARSAMLDDMRAGTVHAR